MRLLPALAFGYMVIWIGVARADAIDLNSHPVVELSELVAALLPTDGFKTMSWDYMVNDPLISWKTDGTETTGSWTRREGTARVTVGGKPSEILRQKWETLPWTVTLSTSEDQKFGPKRIEIKPGGIRRA